MTLSFESSTTDLPEDAPSRGRTSIAGTSPVMYGEFSAARVVVAVFNRSVGSFSRPGSTPALLALPCLATLA
jgi:hypothetical protein